MKIFAGALVLAMAAVLVTAAAIAARTRDGVIIRNTGSTNFPGYTIKLWSDGRATAAPANRSGEQTSASTSGVIPLDMARKFFSDLKAAKESGNVIGRACMKSASFGTSTVVQYHGWTSPDLECPGDGFVVALAAHVHQIAALLQLPRASTRRPLMPGEPRRFSPGSPAQASPTPESAPPAP